MNSTGQAKISNFHHILFSNKNIASGQVPMNTLEEKQKSCIKLQGLYYNLDVTLD